MSTPTTIDRAAGTRTLPSTRAFVLVALAVALLLAGVVSYYASASPDGLEHVASTRGFEDSAQDHATGDGPLADYQVKGVENERLSGGLAGLAGVAITGAVMGGLVLVLRRRGDAGATATTDATTVTDDANVTDDADPALRRPSTSE